MKKVKKRKALRFRLKFFLLVILFALLCYFGWYLVFSKEIFNINKIEVIGLKSYPKAYVLKKTEVNLDDFIFSINEKRINEQIVELTRIKRIEIEKKYPDQILLKVEERKPQYILNSLDSFCLIDSDGIIIGEILPFDELDLPIIVSSVEENCQKGQKLENAQSLILFELLERIPKDSLKNISEVLYINDDVVMYTVDGIKLLWGSPLENLEIKTKVLDKSSLIRHDSGPFEHIDIRYGNNPVIKSIESGV